MSKYEVLRTKIKRKKKQRNQNTDKVTLVMSGQDELVNQFKEIANIEDTEVAKSILESTNWNLEVIIFCFFFNAVYRFFRHCL